MDAHHVAWQAIQEDYETVTSAGRFKTNIMLSIAEAESDRTSERIKVVLDHKAAKGEYTGHRIPIGYTPINGKLMPDENAPAVRATFDTYLRTGNISAAMDEIHRHGHNFRYPTVKRILEHTIYTGKYKGNLTYCEPIISQEDFDAVQTMMKSRSVRRNPSKRIYLFSGLIRCATCGGPMVGKYVAEADRTLYRCARHFNDHLCSNKTHVREAEIEEYLLTNIADLLTRISANVVPEKPKPTNKAAIMKKIERLKDLYVDGFIDKETYIKDRESLLAEIQPPPPTHRQALTSIFMDADLRDHYATLSREDKRTLWRAVIDRIIVDGEDIRVFFIP